MMLKIEFKVTSTWLITFLSPTIMLKHHYSISDITVRTRSAFVIHKFAEISTLISVATGRLIENLLPTILMIN